MYFGYILSYANGGKAHKNPSRIPWKWEILIIWFDIMAQDIWDVSQQLIKNAKEWKWGLGNTSWAQLGICHCCVKKNNGILMARTWSLHVEWETIHNLLFPIWTKSTCTNNSILKQPWHNIGNTRCSIHPIGHKHGAQTWNGSGCWHVCYYMGESIWRMSIQRNPWFKSHASCYTH